MTYILPMQSRPVFENWAFMDGVFSPEECAKIIELGTDWQEATIATGKADEHIRRSDISWIKWGGDTEWLFSRLAESSFKINYDYFNLDLVGFTEPLQLTRYTENKEAFYSWHQDVGPGPPSIRKLSLVVNLTDLSEYEGGQLEIFMQGVNKQRDIPRTQGSVVWFPSYEPHQVKPVTKGTRHSLVSWISGPTFR